MPQHRTWTTNELMAQQNATRADLKGISQVEKHFVVSCHSQNIRMAQSVLFCGVGNHGTLSNVQCSS